MKYILEFLWKIVRNIAWIMLWILLGINLFWDRLFKVLAILFIFFWDLKLKKRYEWWYKYHVFLFDIWYFENLTDYFMIRNSEVEEFK